MEPLFPSWYRDCWQFENNVKIIYDAGVTPNILTGRHASGFQLFSSLCNLGAQLLWITTHVPLRAFYPSGTDLPKDSIVLVYCVELEEFIAPHMSVAFKNCNVSLVKHMLPAAYRTTGT